MSDMADYSVDGLGREVAGRTQPGSSTKRVKAPLYERVIATRCVARP